MYESERETATNKKARGKRTKRGVKIQMKGGYEGTQYSLVKPSLL